MVDFKWHKSTKSPNWAILNEEKYPTSLDDIKFSNEKNLKINLNPSWLTKKVQNIVSKSNLDVKLSTGLDNNSDAVKSFENFTNKTEQEENDEI